MGWHPSYSLSTPEWFDGADHNSGVLPLNPFKSGEFLWKDSRQSFFNGFHASLAAYDDAGNDLILEHILDTGAWLETLCGLLAAHDVLFVAVHCPLDMLIAREKQRGDRSAGSATRDFHVIHVGKYDDVEVDSPENLEANVERILLHWRSGSRHSNFSAPRNGGSS